MIKRIISILMVVILSIGLVACGEENSKEQVKTENDTKQETKQETKKEEATPSTTKDDKVVKVNNSQEKSSSEKSVSKKAANEKSNSTTTNEPAPKGKTVYWTPNGKSYHYRRDCQTLARSKTINEGESSTCPKKDPCDKCAK